MRKLTILTLIFLIAYSLSTVAQERVQEFNEPGHSAAADTGTAKQEAIQDAVAKTVNRLVKEMIGEARFEKSKETIKNKVLSQSERFVPFIRSGEPKAEGAEQVFPITLRVSITSLESVLKSTGLLQSQEGPQTILPMVGFVDLVNNKSLKWWVQDVATSNAFLKSQERAFFEALKKGIKERGWSVINAEAMQYKASVPAALQIESPRSQEVVRLAEHMKSQLVVRGDMRFEPGNTTQSFKVTLRLRVLQTPSGRTVADSTRTAESESGVFTTVIAKKATELMDDSIQDLYGQIQDAMNRGQLGTQVVRLSIDGGLGPKELDILKEDLRFQVRTIKRVSDRLYARSRIELELDVTGGPQALAQTVQNMKYRQAQLKVEKVDGDRIYVSLAK
jgi:hypothetical protein